MKRAGMLALVGTVALWSISAVNVRTPYWAKVRDAVSKGLPKTALESMDPIIRNAKNERGSEATRSAVGDTPAPTPPESNPPTLNQRPDRTGP